MPGGALFLASMTNVPSPLSGAIAQSGWPLLTVSGICCGFWVLETCRKVIATLASGAIRANLNGIVSFSPCFIVSGCGSFSPALATNAFSGSAVTLKNALSRTASMTVLSSRVAVGMFCIGWTPHVIVADLASRITGLPAIVAVPLIVIGPLNAAAVGAADNTSPPDRWAVLITCGTQVTPAGSPSALSVMGLVNPSKRNANTSR